MAEGAGPQEEGAGVDHLQAVCMYRGGGDVHVHVCVYNKQVILVQ